MIALFIMYVFSKLKKFQLLSYLVLKDSLKLKLLFFFSSRKCISTQATYIAQWEDWWFFGFSSL